MKCPHCDQDIEEKPCPQCGDGNPEEALYCMACGTRLVSDHASTSGDSAPNSDDDDFDLENRVLCPDGACTGIMIDGRCSECGRAFEEAEKEQQDTAEGDENV